MVSKIMILRLGMKDHSVYASVLTIRLTVLV